MVEEGRITIHGKRVKPGQRISSGDVEAVLIDGLPAMPVWQPTPFCDEITELLDKYCPSRDEIASGIALIQRWSHYRHQPPGDPEPARRT